VEGIQGRGPLPRKPVVITFDDGYYGVHEYALPVLHRAGFSASVYVIAEDYANEPKGDRAHPVLNRQQARELIDAGLEIGCHSLTHCQISECTGPELLREVVASREILERELATTVRTFAYPYVTPRTHVIHCVRDQGYLAAVGMNPCELSAQDDYLFALPRIPIGYTTRMLQFVYRLRSYVRQRGSSV
jgi:hypothetical protein